MVAGSVEQKPRRLCSFTELAPSMLGLVLAHATTLVLGIAFWAVAARSAEVSAIGRAGLMIATTSSLASLSNLGLGAVLERFLPLAGTRRRRVLITTYGITTMTTVVAAVLFVWIDPVPGLFEEEGLRPLFVLLAAATALFALLDSVLLGVGASVWVMVKNVGHGAFKLLLLVLCVRGGAPSASVMVFAWLVPTLTVIAVLMCLLAMGRAPWQRNLGEGAPWLPSKRQFLHFWTPSFVWLVVGAVPGFVIPVVVGREAGLDQAAYFAVAWTLVIASNGVVGVAMAPFVAGATRSPDKVGALARSFGITMVVLNVGRAVGLAVFGPLILGLYGSGFRDGASTFLWTIAIAHAASAPSYVYGGLARLYRRLLHPMLVQVLASTAVVIAVILLVSRHGLTGIAVAYLLQEALVLALAAPRLVRLWRLTQSGITP